ncbi:hypothetical protein ACFWUT_35300 [Streptomyces cyaneofuscatus]
MSSERGRRRRVRHRRPPYVTEMTYADEHQEHGAADREDTADSAA